MDIRTPDHRIRVFVSSTLGELAQERATTRSAIEGLRLTPVLFETGARPHPPRALYRAYLEQSDVFVGIYWQRYGWVAPGEEASGLEDEYRLAAGRLPQLVYIKEPAPDRDAALAELLGRIQNDDRLAYRRFSTSDELAELVSEDLAVLVSERFLSAETGIPESRRSIGPPAPLDRTFGRDHAVADIADLVRSGHRLVTLTGPGGVGKSRLALEASRALADDFHNSVVFVPLAAVSDPALVVPTIAERMGVRLGGISDLHDEIIAELNRQPTLLVLDNFEQVAAAAPDVVSVLNHCPDSCAIVTSRHVLRVGGEREFQVAPLARDPATSLFVERAAAVRPGFAVDDDNRAIIEDICRQLDGLPLAIELAAATMRLFSPAQLLAQLSQRMELLTRGAADVHERQRTLRGTMEWSYELLDENEQRLFARLAVFSGGWSLPAAEAVCGGADEPDVLETLASLVEKSLVVPADATASEARFHMLETVRAYAAERLAELPDRTETERRHTEWMFELLVGESRSIRPPHHQAWLEHFDLDRANLRSAVQRGIRDGDSAVVTDLIRAALGYLSLRDAEAEAAQWIGEAMATASDIDPLVRARLVVARALMAGALGHYQDAQELVEEARPTLTPIHDPLDTAMIGMVDAVVSSALQAPEDALEHALHAAEAMAAVGSDVGQAYMLQTAGTVALSCDPANAERYLTEGLRLAEEMANDSLLGQSLTLLGYTARRAGHRDKARDYFIAAAEASQRSGQRSSMAYGLDGLAAAAVDMGHAEVAAKALAASEAARGSLDRTPWASFVPFIDEVAQAAGAQLGESAYDAARAEGARSDLGHALLEALGTVRESVSNA